MEMKAALIIAFLHLFHIIPDSNGEINDRDYLIVIPRVLRGGTTVNIGINIFGNISCDVELKLYGNSFNSEVVSRAKGHFQPNEVGRLELKVPKIYVTNVGATVCGVETPRREISYEALPPDTIFIQTDKPIYKPGQKVLIRIIYVNSELKPAGTKVSSVVIQEPSGSKIMQWTDVKLDDGIARLDLQLSKEPVLGKWKIKATVDSDRTATYEIEIEKYVLPKFELEIKPPSYLAYDQAEVPVSICARYTYGKDVTGLLETTMCFKYFSDSTWDAYCVKEVKNITGCQEFDVRESFKRNMINFQSWWSYLLHIKATFTETSTGVKRENEADTPRMRRYSKTMSFVGLNEKFKPGFPFKFKIKVTYLDGKPATDGKVEIEVSRSRFYYRGTRQLFQKTYSVKNGIVADVLEDMPHDTEKLHFKASYNSGKIRKYATSKAWYSPSLSYMQLVKTGVSTAKVGSQGSVKVLYTVRNGTAKHINFHHKILCKGNLVLSGVTKEDLSDQYYESSLPNTPSTPLPNTPSTPLPNTPSTPLPNTPSTPLTNTPSTPLPNTASTPLTTQPSYIPTHPFISIPEPTVKEFEIMFNVTQEMVPSCRILVYYVRSDKETVGDSIVYDIEDKLENQVSIDFTEKRKRPGEKTKIIMKAKPGSRVAISALDKSVLLLRNANEVKKSKVLNILNRQDVGPVRDYSRNCRYSWRMPHVADVSEAFNMAGVVFLSNLNVFTQPCHTSQQWFYEENNRPVTTLPPRTYPLRPTWDGPLSTQAATRLATTAAATEAAMTLLSTTGTSKTVITTRLPLRKKKPIKKVKVRKNFPETWLWTDVKFNDTSGMQTMEVQVPDTITSWVANGFAMSSVYGMGVSNRATLNAFQPFFIQMTLPYSVIRGEEIPITVTVFNYLSSCVPIKLELSRETRDYKVTSFYISKMCVCGDDGKSVKFKIIPNKLGRIPLTVKAITSEADLCPKSTVYAADAVTRKLLVEPEGIKKDYTRGTFFCTGTEGKYNELIDLALPKDIISGSVLPKVSVIGDVMGPALSNLDGLLAMPYGCGEQNMAKFAPNIYIMDYLTNTDQATQKTKDDAIYYMNSGYQRQLRYKRRRGSYSAFGNSDSQGSMMLTAFVVRSFARARKYIFVDEDDIKHSFKWFEGKQNRNSGCFPKYGRLFDRSLQGGVDSELTITAYVTIALLEAGLQVETTMVSKALDCITGKLDDIQDSYTTSLVTYALVLANHSKAEIMMNRLKKQAITSKGDQLFWSAGKEQPPEDDYFGYYYYRSPADVEMTGYALMSYLTRKDSIDDVVKIVKWLSKQRNNYGGFASTQDTCVALQALSEVAQKFYGDTVTNLSISVNIRDIFGHDFKLTADNKLVLQRAEIPSNALPNKVNIAASGSGCALVQASVKYNIPVPEEAPAFKVEVSVHLREATDEEEITACYPLQLKITADWLKEDVSNMAIVDVKLVSGFTVNEELLQKKLEQTNNYSPTILKRYEIEGQNVILYFDEIKSMSFSLDIIQSTLVKKTKPGVVRVYDYYNPESQGKVMYNITEKDCYGEKIEKECPKCLSVDDFKDFFDKNINCSIYLMRAKSINGLMKVKKAYIKTDRTQDKKIRPYEIPEFCPCDEIYDGVTSLVLGQSDYFRRNGEDASIVFNSATIIAKWNAKKMKKIFKKKMLSKIYRRCIRLNRARG